MSTRVAINGFGRMGRLAFRAAFDDPELEVVLINEPACDGVTSAHLLEFDSVQGRWGREPVGEPDAMHVGGRAIAHTSFAEPSQVPWDDHGIDLVLECSGKFKTPDALVPQLGGGRSVVVSAPVKDPAALNVVVGVNDHQYDPAEHRLVTAASCTTNCLAPVVKVIHEGLGITRGSITTLHDLTNTQTIVDAPHKDLRRARACGSSLIPTTTGSATAIALIFPELAGRLNGHAVRVPLLGASLTDCVFEVGRPTTVDEVNGLLRAAADGPLAGILGFEERPLVSVDFQGDPRSSIVDALSTLVVDGTHVKIYSWYDNEWGYANRLVDLARIVANGQTAA